MADYEEEFEQEESGRAAARRRIAERSRLSGVNMGDPAFLEREKLRRRDRRRDALVVLTLAAVFLLFGLFYFRNYSYTTYSLDAESAMGALPQTVIRELSHGNVLIGADTITYMERGKVIWTTSVELKKPVIAVNGDFFAVCDTGGYQIHVCDTTGILCTLKLSRVIYGMDISSSGVVAVVTESDDAAYISWFDRYGSRIPVEIKAVLSATGIPVHIAISPDSQKLMVLYYSTANGIGESHMVLYDFEKGREEDSYIIKDDRSFYESDTYLVDGKFLDESHFCAVGTNRTKFYVYDQKKAEVTEKTIEYDEPVRSVMFTPDAMCLVQHGEDGNYVRVLDGEGDERVRFSVPEEYKLTIVNRESLAFLNGPDLTLYNLSGRKRYEGTLTDSPVSFAFSGKRSLLFNTGSMIEEITLK